MVNPNYRHLHRVFVFPFPVSFDQKSIHQHVLPEFTVHTPETPSNAHPPPLPSPRQSCRINQRAFNCLGKVYLNNLNASDFGYQATAAAKSLLPVQLLFRREWVTPKRIRLGKRERCKGWWARDVDYPISLGTKANFVVQREAANSSRTVLRFHLTTQNRENVKQRYRYTYDVIWK